LIPDFYLRSFAALHFCKPHLACASADFVRRNAWLLQRQDIRLAGYDCNPFLNFEITA
jgi:hypothetical protein